MSEKNDSDQGPDITSVIEKAAKFISKNGAEYEKELFDSYPRYTFLRSSDPNHGIYQQKLIEFRNGAHDTDIIHPPPGWITTLIQGTARYLSEKGSKTEEMIMQSEANNARYNFMRSSDPYHAFYKHKLAEYRSNPQENDDDDLIESDEEADAAAQLTISQSQYILLPNHLHICIPQGMTLQEFKIIKLTAQFVAWYGGAFWLGLKKRAIPHQFEFLDPTGKWYSCFSKLALEYSKVLMPPTDMKQDLVDSAPYTATILDAFLQRLQWGPVQHQEWLEGGKKAMIDWHDSVTKDFANKDENQQPQMQPPPPLEEPEPKRQKFDK